MEGRLKNNVYHTVKRKRKEEIIKRLSGIPQSISVKKIKRARKKRNSEIEIFSKGISSRGFIISSLSHQEFNFASPLSWGTFLVYSMDFFFFKSSPYWLEETHQDQILAYFVPSLGKTGMSCSSMFGYLLIFSAVSITAISFIVFKTLPLWY